VQALRLVIRLLDKLVEDDYRYFYETHNKRWYGVASPEIRFEKVAGSDLSEMVGSAQGHLPADQQELEGIGAARRVRSRRRNQSPRQALGFQHLG
jgi:hypothetical protein